MVSASAATLDAEFAAVAGAGRRARFAGSFWIRTALAAGLLLVSGAARWREAERFGVLLEHGRAAPFRLAEIPFDLGDWHGTSTDLDPRIALATGSSDSIYRLYVNQKTGVAIELFVLYGPATDLFIHTPEECYPKAGYELSEGPETRTPEGLAAPFRSLVFTRGDAPREERQEVYYAWRYNDRWTPQAGIHKELERIPGMFKVQLARDLAPRERRDVDNPCEAILKLLIPEIERRSARASTPAADDLSATRVEPVNSSRTTRP